LRKRNLKLPYFIFRNDSTSVDKIKGFNDLELQEKLLYRINVLILTTDFSNAVIKINTPLKQ